MHGKDALINENQTVKANCMLPLNSWREQSCPLMIHREGT